MNIKFSLLLMLLFTITTSFAQKDWKLVKDKKGIKVWTMDYPNSGFKQFKAETRIKSEIEPMVAAFLDVENMSAWYDRIEKVTLVESTSDKEGVYILDFDLPWPVSDRISAVRAVLTHDPNTNVVTVKTQYEPGVIEDSKKQVVTDIQSEWILTPTDDGYVEIFHKGYMHPSGKLPAWIANSGVKDGPVKTLTKLQEILPEYQKVDVDFID